MNQKALIEQIALGVDSQTAQSLAKQFLLANMDQSNKRFNLYNFVGNDKINNRYNGAHYLNGFKFATDAVMVVAIKETYEPELEGRTIDKKGLDCEGKYPDVFRVIPADGLERVDFDLPAIMEACRQSKALKKTRTNKLTESIKIGKSNFDPKYISKFCQFVSAYSADVYICPVGQILAKSGENVCMLMHLVHGNEYDIIYSNK